MIIANYYYKNDRKDQLCSKAVQSYFFHQDTTIKKSATKNKDIQRKHIQTREIIKQV